MFCNCSLAGTAACMRCPNNGYLANNFVTYKVGDYVMTSKSIPITKKEVIEKFDEKGNLIERITKEV